MLSVNNEDIQIIDGAFDAMKEIKRKPESDIQEQSLHMCDLTDIIKKHQNWKRFLPRITPFYAIKCNDDPVVLNLLAKLGAGFDCASKGEIKKILNIGVSSPRIIFANPSKPIEHLNYAKEKNVSMMTFDNIHELYKIQTYYPDAKLILRIRCDAKEATIPLGAKYGCDSELEAPLLLQAAWKLGLSVVGISFHVGTGCKDLPIYAEAISISRKLFDYASAHGFDMNVLDIGGGFAGDKEDNLIEISTIINDALDMHFPDDQVNIVAEPGRYYVASAYTVVCRIHSKREIVRNGRMENVMYFMNDGIYGSFNAVLTEHRLVQPIPIKSYASDRLFKSTVWGPTCDALDEVCSKILLPKMEIEDLVMFENMGAYSMTLATLFNGYSLPKMEYFIEKQFVPKIFDDY